jgi:cyclopropane-fatty-acyl-phospholipid synthase
MLLAAMLARLIRIGRLSVIDARGQRHDFAGGPGPAATVRLHDPALHWKLLARPRLFVGEAYMDGTLTIEEGTLYDFVDVLVSNDAARPVAPIMRLSNAAGRLIRRFHQYNPIPRARRNVAHHYDLSDELYELFLDRDRQYSCAYFRQPDDDLDTAQHDKKAHLAAKLLLQPGHKVLDIGSGWGGLALYLASECGAEVTGLTLSEEQHKVATRRAAQAGLSDRVRFHLRDYREERGQYDRIVSVGMFEHVGPLYYDTYFRKVAELLNEDGVALIHTIGRMDGPCATNPWVKKYIFPGGYLPALSEIMPAVERSGLFITDIEVLRLHYAKTIRAWRERFAARRAEVKAKRGERFCRMWELYLAGSEAAFIREGLAVFQIQLAKKLDNVPLTRDYIVHAEAHLRGRDSAAANLRLAAE